MKRLLLVVALLVPASGMAQTNTLRLKDAVKDFPRSQLRLKNSGPVSLGPNQDVQAAYETLAQAAGINILFDRDFRISGSTPIRIESADILEAFDLLSAQTHSFVEVLDENTIVVLPDNQTKRREYELMVMKMFRLTNIVTAQGLSQVITTLRTAFNARYLIVNTAANAIVMRDTPDRIALAEKTIAELDKPAAAVAQPAAIATNAVGTLFTAQPGGVQRSSPARSLLRAPANRLISFQTDQNARTTFEELARLAGLNVIFDRDFREPLSVHFKVDNIGILDALDDLALLTGSFWTVLDGETIVVSPDNQTKRRSLDRQIVKTFYFPNAAPPAITEIVTALRTLLNMRYISIAASTNGVMIRDTPKQIALAEKLIADVTGQTPGAAAEIQLGAENSVVLNRRAARLLAASEVQLQPKRTGSLSLDLNGTARQSYEEVAQAAGLRVVFDDRFQDRAAASLKLENVGVLDALDFLSLQTGNVWEVMDSNSVVVGPDNQTVRHDLERRIAKTIALNNASGQGVTEIITALRTILNLANVGEGPGAIVIEDTAANVVLAGKIIADLDRLPRK